MNTRMRFTWSDLRQAWGEIAGSVFGSGVLGRVDPSLSKADARLVRRLMNDCLSAKGGEVSARQRAATLGELYLTLNPDGRQRFLTVLAEEFAIDREQAKLSARALLEAADEATFLKAVSRLRQQLVSPQQVLLRQFNALPQGIKFLVDLRAELLPLRTESPQLASLDQDLRQLLSTWFDVGFLSVQRITWQSPAALLEKLIAYEAVHAINSWTDLHNRLESDRHCYAFFHPGMPDEPLIFIEVALVEGLSTSVQVLLDESLPEISPETADTAIFYSISNTQKGLQGISFGPFLIKQVVSLLCHELPNLKTFSTLSPIPGFRRWLQSYLDSSSTDGEATPIGDALAEAAAILGCEPTLAAVMEQPQWLELPEVSLLLKEPLLALCARYLHELRPKDGAPLDPVARFHLGNGAQIEQLNWLGDTSVKGVQESCGLMVNYLYRLKDIEKNIEAHAEQAIAASSKVRRLLREDEEEQGRLQALRSLLSRGRSGNGRPKPPED